MLRNGKSISVVKVFFFKEKSRIFLSSASDVVLSVPRSGYNYEIIISNIISPKIPFKLRISLGISSTIGM